MNVRRVFTLSLTVAILSTGSTFLLAQAPPKVDKKEQEKRNKQQTEDVTALVTLVDAASASNPVTAAGTTADQRQGEVNITVDVNHFIKGQDGSTYLPILMTVERAALPGANVALYIRAVNRNAPAPAAPAAPAKDDKTKAAAPRPSFAWDNAYFLSLKNDGKVGRALQLPGGDYDLFIAVKETSNGDKKQMPKMGLLRRSLTVPDYKKPEVATSSIMVGALEPLEKPLSAEQQQENPYTFGTMRIVPNMEGKFAKGGELSLIFWIYGTAADPITSKPNVLVEYAFHQKLAEGEKYFNKTAPQELNAQTLPPEFNPALGHQLPGSLAVPLMSFPAGDYRLEIKVTDKAAGKAVTQNVNFTVLPS